MSASLVGSEMCIRDSCRALARAVAFRRAARGARPPSGACPPLGRPRADGRQRLHLWRRAAVFGRHSRARAHRCNRACSGRR
eukprot:9690423-Alexandrium_andersonii.AAC.1